MFREEDTLLAGGKNGNAPTIVSSKLIIYYFYYYYNDYCMFIYKLSYEFSFIVKCSIFSQVFEMHTYVFAIKSILCRTIFFNKLVAITSAITLLSLHKPHLLRHSTEIFIRNALRHSVSCHEESHIIHIRMDVTYIPYFKDFLYEFQQKRFETLLFGAMA